MFRFLDKHVLSSRHLQEEIDTTRVCSLTTFYSNVKELLEKEPGYDLRKLTADEQAGPAMAQFTN